MTPMISVDQLSVEYGDQKVLCDLSLDIEEGQFIGILGPNGCGKTTFLRVLSRILAPDTGTVIIKGLDVEEYNTRELARILGCVRQETDVVFPFTVREIVMMGRYPHIGRIVPLCEDDMALVEKAMQWTNTLHLANKLITEVSGGERQRVLIARTLVQQPKILLLDESTSHLDINHQMEILSLIQELTPKITVIGVFHDFNLASYFCDQLILMNSGKIVAIGPPEDVLTEERISENFSVKMLVHMHPLTGKPYLVPAYDVEVVADGFRIHVISGGGSGSELYHLLLLHGFHVTAGVLAANDSDAMAATSLGIEAVIEPPFAAVSDAAVERLYDMIVKANAVVVAGMPIGPGNLENLSVLKRIDVPVYFLGRCEDYANGAVDTLFSELIEDGAVTVMSVADLIRRILP